MIDSIATSTGSPTRTRTRNAILTAAVGVLTQNRSASLADISGAAHVARSTLHRYFPDRAALLDAVRRFAGEQVEAATRRARIDEGSASEALLRLCHEYFDNWHMLMWVYQESLGEGCEQDAISEELDPAIGALIARGHVDGSIDASMPNAWIQHLLWAVLYTAWEYVQMGESKHDALALALASLEKVIRPQRSVVVPPVISHRS